MTRHGECARCGRMIGVSLLCLACFAPPATAQLSRLPASANAPKLLVARSARSVRRLGARDLGRRRRAQRMLTSHTGEFATITRTRSARPSRKAGFRAPSRSSRADRAAGPPTERALHGGWDGVPPRRRFGAGAGAPAANGPDESAGGERSDGGGSRQARRHGGQFAGRPSRRQVPLVRAHHQLPAALETKDFAKATDAANARCAMTARAAGPTCAWRRCSRPTAAARIRCRRHTSGRTTPTR